jgi:2-succinyl-5-enolpyruvyl-6-hydroxy-3-cyclohexene-1-carboxylate synthase
MPAENAGRAFALVIADELARRGVRHAVIAPGSRSTPIALTLLEHPDITVHVRIDERSAAYLALGIAKASGQVVPVLCTSGTATSYFLGAVMEADLSRVPVLALTADRPAELHGIGANQTVDQRGMYDAYVRWSADLPAPEAKPDAVDGWRTSVVEAVSSCLGIGGGPAGPVHLNLGLREPLLPVDDGEGFPYEFGLGADAGDLPRTPDSTVPAALRERLAGVRRGVVVAGGATPASGRIVADLALRGGWPLIAEPHSCARVEGAALRCTDPILRSPGFTTRHRPDLVVVVGRVGLSRTLLGWLESVPHVVVSVDRGHWDVTRSALEVIQCDLAALTSLDLPDPDPGWSEAWRTADADAANDVDAVLDAAPTLSEPAVARIVGDVAEGASLVVGSSMPIRDLDLVLRPGRDPRIYANRGVSGIDGFVSTAIGIAIARPERRTIAFCGDLTLLHDINGLLPGPDPRPDITFVVVNNDGGGIFSLLPQGSGMAHAAFERLFGTPPGISLEALAAAYHVDHRRVSTAEDLTEALSTYGGVRLIEVRTDRAENAALHARLREVTVSG